jgi:transposase InsO family protein
MIFPLVDELDGEGVAITRCGELLGFNPTSFYKWKAQPRSDREIYDEQLLVEIREIHADDPEFGHRFIWDELKERGHTVGRDRVKRLCKTHQIHSSTVKRKRGRPRSGPPVTDDLLQRYFEAEELDVAWVSDITEHPTDEGTWYFCGIKDLCSTRIVGYATSARMTSPLVCRALQNAVDLRRPDPDRTIIHSDRGGQYRSQRFQKLCRTHRLNQSMGRVGACGDNAAMESFFSLLQKNVLNRQPRWATRDELTIAVVDWIERTYHRRRRQDRLGRLTPIAYELALFETTLNHTQPPHTTTIA